MTTTLAYTATFSDILAYPEDIVNSLSTEDIKRILMETILAYIDKTTTLATLVTVGEQIRIHTTIQLEPQIAHALTRLNTLSFCKENPCPMDTTDNTLINILEELVQ